MQRQCRPENDSSQPLALIRLLDTVADVAKDMRDEGTKAIQTTSSARRWKFFHRVLNLFFTKPRTPRTERDRTGAPIGSATVAAYSAVGRPPGKQRLLPESQPLDRLGTLPSASLLTSDRTEQVSRSS